MMHVDIKTGVFYDNMWQELVGYVTGEILVALRQPSVQVEKCICIGCNFPRRYPHAYCSRTCAMRATGKCECIGCNAQRLYPHPFCSRTCARKALQHAHVLKCARTGCNEQRFGHYAFCSKSCARLSRTQ